MSKDRDGSVSFEEFKNVMLQMKGICFWKHCRYSNYVQFQKKKNRREKSTTNTWYSFNEHHVRRSLSTGDLRKEGHGGIFPGPAPGSRDGEETQKRKFLMGSEPNTP